MTGQRLQHRVTNEYLRPSRVTPRAAAETANTDTTAPAGPVSRTPERPSPESAHAVKSGSVDLGGDVRSGGQHADGRQRVVEPE